MPDSLHSSENPNRHPRVRTLRVEVALRLAREAAHLNYLLIQQRQALLSGMPHPIHGTVIATLTVIVKKGMRQDGRHRCRRRHRHRQRQRQAQPEDLRGVFYC